MYDALCEISRFIFERIVSSKYKLFYNVYVSNVYVSQLSSLSFIINKNRCMYRYIISKNKYNFYYLVQCKCSVIITLCQFYRKKQAERVLINRKKQPLLLHSMKNNWCNDLTRLRFLRRIVYQLETDTKNNGSQDRDRI